MTTAVGTMWAERRRLLTIPAPATLAASGLTVAAAISYVIWVHAMGDKLPYLEFFEAWIASLAVLVWGILIPWFIQGDPADQGRSRRRGYPSGIRHQELGPPGTPNHAPRIRLRR